MNHIASGFMLEVEKVAGVMSAAAKRVLIGAGVGGAAGAATSKEHRLRSALLGAGAGAAAGYGAHKFLGVPTTQQRRAFEIYKGRPFNPNAQIPFSKLHRTQKLRVGAGIAGNVAMGVIPTIGAVGYGINRLRGKDSYKDKYEQLEMQNRIRDRIANAQ